MDPEWMQNPYPKSLHPSQPRLMKWSGAFKIGFTMVNLSSKQPPEVGESILWKGIRKGKSDGPSTKEEFFHGRIRHVAVENDEIFLFLD